MKLCICKKKVKKRSIKGFNGNKVGKVYWCKNCKFKREVYYVPYYDGTFKNY